MFNLFSIFNTILKWVGNLYREGRLVKYIFINITIFIFIGCISYYYYFYLEFNLGDVVSLEVVSFYMSFIVSFLISSFVFDKFKYSDKSLLQHVLCLCMISAIPTANSHQDASILPEECML